MFLEQLETRRLLAGNVTAAYVPATDTIVITGDNKANGIFVEGLAAVGTYTITGLPGTTVNGQPSAVVLDPTPGLPGPNIAISMGNGEDFVGTTFAGLSANRISIVTGNGQDEVSLPNVTAFGGLNIQTENGDDFVHMGWVDVFNGLNIDTGRGDDVVFFDTFLGNGTTVFSGTGDVNGGQGEDTLISPSNLHPATVTTHNFEDIIP